MKRFLLVVIFLLILGGTAMAGFLQHPNFSNINTFTASIVGQIKTSQDAFFLTNRRYFQGLWLLGSQQVTGETVVTITNTSRPSDFPFAWKDFNATIFKSNLKIPVNVRIDVYQSPLGWGWRLIGECWIAGLGPDAYGNDGNHWMYVHSEGPEASGLIENEWFILGE